jgi:hypothetical protein
MAGGPARALAFLAPFLAPMALASVLAAGCDSGSDDPAVGDGGAACTPGAALACTCGAERGYRICGPSATFGACSCGGPEAGTDAVRADVAGIPDAAPASDSAPGLDAADAAAPDQAVDLAADARPDLPPETGPGSDVRPQSAPAGCVSPGRLLAGSERLLDLYPIADGIVVVRSDAVVLVGRDRNVKKTVTAPRPITSAAFDGTRLVTADAAMLTVYNTALDSEGTVLLTESCASSVLMDGGVFVCGPSNDWDRVFYTYDIVNRRAIATASRKYTYKGIPMRRIPTTNYFVTVTVGTSPSDFNLFQVAAGGTDVTHINESPYHGGFSATEVYGFAGNPPTHLVNVEGLLMRLFGNGCDGTTNSFTSGCFVKDGNLGTLWSNERFASLTNDASGTLYAVVAQNGTSYFDPQCKTGCLVQKIDVQQRKVVSQRQHMMGAKRFIASRPDPSCDMLAVGYEVAPAGSSGSSFEWSGYQVDLVDYGAP